MNRRLSKGWQLWTLRLREQIDERKITPEEITNRMITAGYASKRKQLKPGTVRAWISGGRAINLEDFFRICELTGISPVAVLFGNEYEKDFLDLAEAWRSATPEGKTAIQIAVKIARGYGEEAAGGGLPPDQRRG